jgi:arylsulfatase A-like enzyme
MPYSNDFRKPFVPWMPEDVPLAIYSGTTGEGSEIVEHPIDQNTLTTRYTRRAVSRIEQESNANEPFFLYVAYNMPHLPIHTAERFRGQSNAGLYGDVIETIDWSAGQIMAALDDQNITDNTIVFFASDNGPWLNLPDRMLQEGNKPWHAGSPGPLRGAKGTTYEGGTRVPAIIRWPEHIEAGVETEQLAASQDIYRTVLEVAGAELPDHRIEGKNLLPWLTGQTETSPRKQYAYVHSGKLEALRRGPWKLRLAGNKPQLFNLQTDPGSRWNRAADKPELVDELRSRMERRAEQVEAELP